MAELTKLETKLAEVIGLAMAAQVATDKVRTLLGDGGSGLAASLQRMKEEASEAEARCLDVAANFQGKKTAIHDRAKTTRGKAAEMLQIYLGGDPEALDGFEFLTMAEAAELAHWNVLQVMNDRAGDQAITELVSWALPIQERHHADASEGAKQLAADTDPTQPA
jgi:hypothetical protein